MKKYIPNFISFAISVLCVVVAIFLPFLFLPLSILASLSFAFCVATQKTPILPLSAIALFLMLFLVFGRASTALLYILMFLPIGGGIGVAYKYKSNLNRATMIVLFTTCVLVLVMCVSYIMEVSPIFSVQEALEPFKQKVTEVANQFYQTLDAETINTFLGTGQEGFANMLFSMLTYQAPVIAAFFTLIMTVFIYFIIKKIYIHNKRDISFISSFDTLRCSRTGAALYMISTLILFFLSLSSTISPIYLVLNVFTSIMSYILAFDGLSIIWFFMKNRNINHAARIFALIGIIIFSIFVPLVASLLAFVAVLDSFSDVRAKITGA